MNKNSILTAFIISLLLFSIAGLDSVLAGFGISPPYVRNEGLTRNSEYTQEITLVRGDPVSDQKAQISIDVPGINDWFSIDQGTDFLLPKGEQKVPMTVRVRVPRKAKFENYKGRLQIRTVAADQAPGSGSVNIALGAQVDVDITVVDKKIFDFRVRRIGISDLNEGHSTLWLDYPGKIRFEIDIENTGNVAVSPSKVTFDIYDFKGEELLEQTENSNRITKVDPFDTKRVSAEIPTELPAGGYLARYAIYNDEEIKQEGEVNLSILPYGTTEVPGYGFGGLSLGDKLSIILPLLLLLTLIFGGALYWWRRKKKQ